MIDSMNLGRFEELSCLDVQHEGVLFPTVPKTTNDIPALKCAGITLGVGTGRLAAEVQGLRLECRSNEVPASPAVADLIQSRKLARNLEGLVVARRHGAHEADMASDGGQSAEQSDRLKMSRKGASTSGMQIRIGHGGEIRQEKHVELGRFCDRRAVSEMCEAQTRIGRRLRHSPSRHVMAGSLQENP